MFFSLGLKNAWRNRGRTALGIVSMCIAAMLFMSSSTLSKGYPAMAYVPARQLLGGDIVLLPGKLALTREDMASGGYVWRFGTKSLDEPNLVMGFETEPYSYGTIQGYPVSGEPGVPGERFQEVVSLLKQDDSIESASVRRSLPFLIRAEKSYMYGFLDARNVTEDLSRWGMASTVRGAYLDEREEDFSGVLVNGWSNLSLPAGVPVALEIPRYNGANLNYENPLTARLTIKGVASFTEGSGVAARNLSVPAVFVTGSTLTDLAEQAGYPEEATYWGISVTLKDMSALENVAALLRREFPDFTTFTAPQLSAASTQNTTVSTGVPMDMRRITQTIAFVTAALLSATNLTILMLSRKNEIGILRALGATRWDITCMVLTESVWISLIGALIGVVITQPALLWQLLSNKVGQDVVLREVGTGFGRAVLFAASSAAVFGFLPVARALRITPAQVLRGE
jgi:hypothetical protein